MARVFITGSADGLGELAATSLIEQGHQVVLHARNAERAEEARKKNPTAISVVIGDLSNIEDTKNIAHQVNQLGNFDAVINNAGVWQATAQEILAVNVLSPYILTCLIHKPKRLIYLSSGMHVQGSLNPGNFSKVNNRITYSDSKLHVLLLCMAVARKWSDVYSNAVNPGWVPTRMGGSGAPDDLEKGYETQVWLAVSEEEKAKVSGRYFFHQKERHFNPEASKHYVQEELLNLCKQLTDISFPQ